MLIKILFVLLWIGILVLSWPLCIFFTFAIAPALVCATVDIRPGKNTSWTVTFFNLAGIAIPASRFLRMGPPTTFAGAVNIRDLMIVYLFAGMGYFIVGLVPKITVIVSDYRNERRAIVVREKMAKLIEEWGPEVKK